MKTKKLTVIFILLFLATHLFAQKGYIGKINLLNAKGQKEGLWIDKGKGYLDQTYYKNGLEDGVSIHYNYDKLDYFGEYKEGRMTGTWYNFGDQGHLIIMLKDFAVNRESVSIAKKEFTPENKCYFTSYHPNGKIESEGLLLFFEEDGPFLDTPINFGKWKYYDESGKLIKTEVFTKDQ